MNIVCVQYFPVLAPIDFVILQSLWCHVSATNPIHATGLAVNSEQPFLQNRTIKSALKNEDSCKIHDDFLCFREKLLLLAYAPGGARCCLGLLFFNLQQLLECGSISGTAAYFCTCSSPALVQLPVLIQKAIRDTANITARTDCRRAHSKGLCVCVSFFPFLIASLPLYIKAIAYIFCADCLPPQSICSWVHRSKTNFEIWGSNCIVSQGNSLQNKSGLRRQKSSHNLSVLGQISTEFHGSSLSFGLDNLCRTDYEESVCAMQEENIVLQNHCSLPCFLYSLWPITYKCFHCNLSDCWLTACWVCCSLRTSGLPTLSPTSYTT